jgi:branched-subunit amino acid permease
MYLLSMFAGASNLICAFELGLESHLASRGLLERRRSVGIAVLGVTQVAHQAVARLGHGL